MPTIREWLYKHENEFPTKKEFVEACAEAVGVKKDSVYNVVAEIWPTKKTDTPKSPADLVKDLISPEEFLAEVDDVRKILNFLNEVVTESYIEDEKLRRKFDISHTRWKNLVELPVFEGKSLTYDCGGGRKKTVWSSRKGIEAAKSTISLARYEQ